MSDMQPMPGDMLVDGGAMVGTVFDVTDNGALVKYHTGSNVSGWVKRDRLVLVQRVDRHFFNIWEIEHGG